MKTQTFGFGQNKLSVNVKGPSDNEGLEISYKESNLDIASKQQQSFYDKIEQANQIGKQISNNGQSIQKQVGDLIQNAEKLTAKDLEKDVNMAKSAIKQADHLSSSAFGFGKNLKNLENTLEKNISAATSQSFAVNGSLKFNDNVSIGLSGLKSVSKQAEANIKQAEKASKIAEDSIENSVINKVSSLSNSMLNGNIQINGNKLAISGLKSVQQQAESSIKQADKMIQGTEQMVADFSKNASDTSLSFGNNKLQGYQNYKIDQQNPFGQYSDQINNDLKQNCQNKLDKQVKKFIKKVNQFSNNLNNSLNENYADINKSIASVNPFVSKNDMANLQNISYGIDKTANGVNSLVKTNGQYVSKNFEQETQDYSIDLSSRNPFQNQFYKSRPDPVNTNQSESVLAAKQGKRVFQQEVPNTNLQQINNAKNFNSSQIIQVYNEKVSINLFYHFFFQLYFMFGLKIVNQAKIKDIDQLVHKIQSQILFKKYKRMRMFNLIILFLTINLNFILFSIKKEEKSKAAKFLKNIPWLLLGIIGLWTFIFMISDIVDYSNWKFIQENSLTNVASWYSKDQKMQEAALSYNGGLGRNYISLIDFILFYYITKLFYNLWLTNEYFEASTFKNALTAFLFLKDFILIILALTSGNYSSFSGWSGFGYFWLSTFGKISIIISFSKIFFFRLNYFRQFSQQKDCCCSLLTNWGNSLYSWASAQGTRNPEVYISLVIFCLYLPLVLHCIVGIIESTYILIIWISILFFLQQLIQLFMEICKPRSEHGDQSLQERLLDSQKSGITELASKFWVYFTLLYVIIPGVASVSFAANFKNAITFHFNGQQLMFNYFSIPESGSGYQNTMTFVCNLLCLI